MDWKLRSEIAQVFASESVRYHYEVMNEVWLTGAKLAERIQFFSPSWLKRYGYLLPRERMVMVDEDNGFCAKPTVAKHAIINDKINFFIISNPKFVSGTTSIICVCIE